MKKLLTIVSFLCLLNIGQAQEIKISEPGRKLLTFNQSRIVFGFGLQGGLPVGYGLKASEKVDENETNQNILYGCKTNIGIYSPNSIIDFRIGANYLQSGENGMYIRETDDETTEIINLKMVEVPAYIRFKFGSVTSTSSFVLLLGAAKNFYPESSSFNYQVKDILLINNSLKVGVATEFQFFANKYSRGNFELIYSHPMGELFTEEYKYQYFPTDTFKDINIGFLTLSINYFFG